MKIDAIEIGSITMLICLHLAGKWEDIEAYYQGLDERVPPDVPIFHLTMPCGVQQDYARSADVPREDTPCPCGDPSHWLVTYKIEQ